MPFSLTSRMNAFTVSSSALKRFAINMRLTWTQFPQVMVSVHSQDSGPFAPWTRWAMYFFITTSRLYQDSIEFQKIHSSVRLCFIWFEGTTDQLWCSDSFFSGGLKPLFLELLLLFLVMPVFRFHDLFEKGLGTQDSSSIGEFFRKTSECMQKGFLVDLTAINARNASLSEEGDFLEEPGLRHQGDDLLQE